MKTYTKRKIKISIYSILSVILFSSIFIWLSFHSLKLWTAERMVANQQYRQENANGVYAEFSYLPSEWTRTFKQPMNDIWKPLHIKGMNYFVFGKPRHLFSSYSERSDPYSKYYQAWFGVYIIKGCVKWIDKNNSKINVAGLARIAKADQLAWLRAMGDKNPIAKFKRADSTSTLIVISGKNRQLIRATIKSQSDISNNANKLINLIGMPKLGKIKKELSEYHNITLNGYFCPWYDSENDVTVIIYASGSKFKTSSGKTYDYFDKLEPEFINMIKGVKIRTMNKN